MGSEFEITNDKENFQVSESAKINYSSEIFKNCISIIPNTLLFEEEINSNFKKQFKETEDVFSKIFYLISRYEEYLPHKQDTHGRYLASNSMLENIEIPFVNIWIEKLKIDLLGLSKSISFQEKKYNFIATYDIDQIYSFKGKGFVLNLGGVFKDVLRFKFKSILNRISVTLLNSIDPFDTFDLFSEQNKQNAKQAIFFFLAAQKRNQYDKNSNPKSTKFKNIVKKIKQGSEIGIHPSYYSTTTNTTGNEILSLNSIINQNITKSRQHYLKLEFPKTYQNLIENNIQEDFSLGYPEKIGFRAGTCTPFYFFELTTNKSTNLKLYPLNIMDTTLVFYLNYSPKVAFEKSKEIIKNIKKYNGTFSMLWHNSTFADSGFPDEWKKVYIDLMNYAKE